MSKVYLCYGDVHASPFHNNSRAHLLAGLINDLRPDVVVNIGDGADMASLSTYEKGTAHFYGRFYKEDVESFLDFEDKVWSPVRRMKKKMPDRYYFVGNHDYRIERALARQPELVGAISMKDLQLESFYNEVIPYNGYGTPGEKTLDGVLFSHYVVGGVSGRALSSLHQGYQLLQKKHQSVIVGHQHIFDYNVQSVEQGTKRIHGMCLPCFTEGEHEWAGTVVNLWDRGVCILRGVENGDYDLEYVSLRRLREIYGDYGD